VTATGPRQRWFPTEPQTAAPLPPVPPVPLEPQSVPAAPRRRRLGWWFLGSAVALFVAVVGIDVGMMVAGLLATSPILGVALGVLALLSAALGLGWVWREVRALARLRRAEALRAEAERLAASEDFSGRAEEFLGRLRQALPARPEVARGLDAFDRLSTHGDTDAEALAKFARLVLTPIDAEARAAIRRAAAVAAVGTSVMPSPAFDAAFALWRGLRLVRTLANLYGVSPGPVATLALLRHLLNTASAGAAIDLASKAAIEQLGLGVAERVSATVAEGLFVGVRVARLGLVAMQHCRPIPFAAEELPQLRHLLSELARPAS